MSYKLTYTKQFEKDFGKLDVVMWQKVKDKLGEVSNDPSRYKHMKYNFSGSSRIRIGKLRVVFSYDVSEGIVYLEKIVFGHKYGW